MFKNKITDLILGNHSNKTKRLSGKLVTPREV